MLTRAVCQATRLSIAKNTIRCYSATGYRLDKKPSKSKKETTPDDRHLVSTEEVLFPPSDVKLPIQSFGTNGKYASALFRSSMHAGGQGELDRVTKDLNEILSTLNKDERLDTFFKLTSVGRDEKAKVLNQITANMSPVVAGFMLTLAENGRLGHVRDIFHTFSEITAAHSGIISADVKSAEPLSDAQKKRLQSALNKKAGDGKTVNIKYIVDPEIKGGLVIDLGDQWMDLSLSSQIRKASNSIAQQITSAYADFKSNVENKALKAANLTPEAKAAHDNVPLKSDHFVKNYTEESVAKYNKLAAEIIKKREAVIARGGI